MPLATFTVLALCVLLGFLLICHPMFGSLWQYRYVIGAMLRTITHGRQRNPITSPLSPHETSTVRPPSILQRYTALRQWRIRRYLRSNAALALDVLRDDTHLATEAVRTLYAMEAQGQAPSRTTFTFPSLSMYGGMRPLQRTLPKLSPAALRQFGTFPPSRRALNAIENPIMDLPWHIDIRQPVGKKMHEAQHEPTKDQQKRIMAVTNMLTQPNNEMSWREFLEPVLDDILTFGGGPIEVHENESDERPLFLWPVDAQSVRINCAWQPGRETFRYSQARGFLYSALGTTDDIYLDDNELLYIKLNPRTNTPFGLGYLEVAFDTVNAFMGAFDYATRRASNMTPQFGIFLGENVTVDQVRTWQHYWENEIEGYGKVPILGGGRQPSVFNMQGAGQDTLWLQWQEFLIRVIAMSFGLSPMRLALERDVNKSTAAQGASDDWATISPVANTVKDAITHWILWKRLGWRDLEFQWDIKTADEAKQAEIMLDQWESDAIKVDEIRQVYGRPPLEDGLGNHTKSAYEAIFKTQHASSDIVTPFDHEKDDLRPHEAAFLRNLLRQKRHERHGLAAVAT